MIAAPTQDASAAGEAEREFSVVPAAMVSALSAGLMVATIVLIGLTWSVPVTPFTSSRIQDVVVAVAFFAYSLIGALIVLRRPENRVGWVFLASGLTLQLALFAYWYAVYGLLVRPGTLPFSELMAWTFRWTLIVGLGLAFSFLLLVFPTGRLPSRRWRPVAWFAAFAVLFTGSTWATDPGPLEGFEMVTNPVGIAAVARLDLTGTGWVLTVLAVVASATSLIVRYIRSTGVERRQIQWFAYAATLMVLALVAVTITNVSEWRFFGVIVDLVFPLALVALPAAAFVAIFKHDLYDIDVVISKTVTYGALGIFITAVYVAIVVGIGTLVGRIILEPIYGHGNMRDLTCSNEAWSVMSIWSGVTEINPSWTATQSVPSSWAKPRSSPPIQ